MPQTFYSFNPWEFLGLEEAGNNDEEQQEILPCSAKIVKITNLGLMTVRYSREVTKSVSLNDTTVEIYVEPYDMDSYTQSLQNSKRRVLKKGGGKASTSGLPENLSSQEGFESLNFERYNLTWEQVSFTDTEAIFQLYFKSPIHISPNIEQDRLVMHIKN